MHTLQLYINDQLVDLSDDSPIALTFQINNLAEVKNQQGNTSNQFKLPLTQNNRRILGFPDDIAFCTPAPYSQYPARMIQDGLEIVPYGVAELNGIEQDTASITVLSGNVDFFDAIEAKIYDMGDSTTTTGSHKPLSVFEHAWTLNNVVGSQSKTEGWIWPVIDYGKMSADALAPVNVKYMRPGFFLHSAISAIVNNAGFKATGSLLTDPLYKKLIIQFANDSFQHSTDEQNKPNEFSMSVHSTADQFISYRLANSHGEGTIALQETDNDPSRSFIPAPSYAYVAPADISVTVDFIYSLRVRGTRKNHSAGVQIFLQKWDPSTNLLVHVANIDHWATQPVNEYAYYTNQKLSVELDLTKGQTLIAAYHFDYEGSEAYINSGATLTVTNKQNEVLYNQKVQCERILPDIGQKDLIKDTLQRFGVICQTDNTTKTVNFAFLSDIVNNIHIAKDWTGKCLDQGKSISFQLGNYAQVNNMKYKTDDNVLPAGNADSQIKIADTTLSATADLFESQFAPTLNRPWQRGTIALINKIDPNDPASIDFSISTQPRILIDEKRNGFNITFTDGAVSLTLNTADTISTPYFDKSGGEYSLKYDNLRLKYYPELERILKNTKKVVRYFLLTPRDILELDLLIPVYLQQDSAYYYINKIDSWRKGQPAKVELVKLG